MEVQQVQGRKRGPDGPPPKSSPKRKGSRSRAKALLSINVRGLGGSNKSSSLFRSFINSNSDVIFMQETMACRQSTISYFSNRWDGKSFWSPALGKQGEGGSYSCF